MESWILKLESTENESAGGNVLEGDICMCKGQGAGVGRSLRGL